MQIKRMQLIITFLLVLFTALLLLIVKWSRWHSRDTLYKKTIKYSKEGKHQSSGGTYIAYRLFKPVINSDQNSLLVILHGFGNRGNDNRRQLDKNTIQFIDRVLKNYPAYILVPQCPDNMKWTVNPKQPLKNFNIDSIPKSEALETVIAIINELIKKNSVDIDRVYITGFSMGATGTWEAILRNPDLFAAAVPICGASDPSHAFLLKNTSVWAFSAELDQFYNFHDTQQMVDELRKYCNKDIKFTLYKGKGHNIAHYVFSDNEVIKWLFSQSKSKNLK